MDKRTPPSVTWRYSLAVVLSLAISAAGIFLVYEKQQWLMLAVGFASLVAVFIIWPLALILESLLQHQRQTQDELYNLVSDRLEQISVLLNTISEQQLLSDRAKAVAFREKDRDALRRAIREEMNKQDWDAALVLANDMESQFGYRQEVDGLREEINRHRQGIVTKQIADITGVIDRHCRAEAWSDAIYEAQRLIRLFPDNPQALALPQDIEVRRQSHKKQLVESWNEAVNRKDIDGSIEILKKLDLYLTPAEAESMQETARGIFKAKLDILKTQFSSAVTDHKWSEAIKLGEAIISEFPNTRVAQEVREKMDALRGRASGLPASPTA